MRVINIHSRTYPVIASELGSLLDSLSSRHDLLWPRKLWPAMKFDKPLSVPATGGHGPIRYYVDEYIPGKRVLFKFTGPTGFDGYHGFDVFQLEIDETELRQTLQMNTHGIAQLSWPLIFRPLHDALIEDALSLAELRLNLTPNVSKWSWWVRTLRWALSAGISKSQVID